MTNSSNNTIRTALFLSLLFTLTFINAQIKGVVTDSITKEPIGYISVYYDGTTTGTMTDDDGKFSLAYKNGFKELSFSAIGYVSKAVKIGPNTKQLKVELAPDNIVLSEVVIKPSRRRYKRKNNPAVDLMRNVIENKREFVLEDNDYYEYDRYQKMKTSLNDLTEEKLGRGIYKGFGFKPDQLEKSEVTGGYILPVSIQETATRTVYRKSPRDTKTFIEGTRVTGVENFLSIGDAMGPVLNDVFSDINIYKDNIRLLNRRFVSPIGTGAISFYQFFIMDTIRVEQDSCIHLTFVPQNSQDFGFTGHIYILNDSSYAVKKCVMNLPHQTGVNFVTNMDIVQEFVKLDDDNWALKNDIMTADLHLVNFIQGIQIERSTSYSNYSFDEIPDKEFNHSVEIVNVKNQEKRSSEYWAEARQTPLTEVEGSMDTYMERLSQAPAFKYVLFGVKLLFENYLETSKRGNPSKFDIGPVNTIMSSNHVDGFRLRLGGTTTAALHPQWFLSGYGAYGFRDKRWKYNAELVYSFNECENFPWEFQKHNIGIAYKSDVISPMDKFLETDKDNVFMGWRAFPVDQMSYIREAKIEYNYETKDGLGINVQGRRRNDRPTGQLEYIKNDGFNENGFNTIVRDITTSELSVNFRYAPGEQHINTKQRRRPMNRDVPVLNVSHTIGFKGFLGGDYNFNLTEVNFFNRFWLSSWGKLDMTLKAGAQWNRVPFPLLIIPAANLSYMGQSNETFSLIQNMEFLNDRYASASFTYDMNGKLLNRIPLLRKLKWREVFRIKALWGSLSDRNNPFVSEDENLFLFPKRNGEYTSFVMDKKKPYIEASVGIYNIFKLLHIEYVRRLTYTKNPGTSKNGIRFMIQLTF